jgi:hypothetical protein
MGFLQTLEQIHREGREIAVLLPCHGEVTARIVDIKEDTVILDVHDPQQRLFLHFSSVVLLTSR